MDLVFAILFLLYLPFAIAGLTHQFWFTNTLKKRYPDIHKRLHKKLADRSIRSDLKTSRWIRDRKFVEEGDPELTNFMDRHTSINRLFLNSIVVFMIVLLILPITIFILRL